MKAYEQDKNTRCFFLVEASFGHYKIETADQSKDWNTNEQRRS